MPDEQPNPDQQYQFAVAMATGQKLSVWAQKNGVPVRTCYDWTKTKEYKLAVQQVRRCARDRAVGRLARNHTKAFDRITRLAKTAKNESVRLQAARAALMGFMAVRERVDNKEQMTDIERRLDERDAKVR